MVTKLLEGVNKKWLVTGAAGFIGSHLCEVLLRNNQTVYAIDNFATGYQENLDSIRNDVGEIAWKNFNFFQRDIVDPSTFADLLPEVDIILHQAALGSVPRSVEFPENSHRTNVDGFFNLLNTLRKNPEKRLVFASSSSVYGDDNNLPKIEDRLGRPMSPYALTKLINEQYAFNFGQVYGISWIGLRYFNVFGPRQNRLGNYAAVIPLWINNCIEQKPVKIFGDGETSRDFSFIENIIQANIRAALTDNSMALRQMYNIAFGERTTLMNLYQMIQDQFAGGSPLPEVLMQDFRKGDVRHSLADISKARTLLGYEPEYSVRRGIEKTVLWYKKRNIVKAAIPGAFV